MAIGTPPPARRAGAARPEHARSGTAFIAGMILRADEGSSVADCPPMDSTQTGRCGMHRLWWTTKRSCRQCALDDWQRPRRSLAPSTGNGSTPAATSGYGTAFRCVPRAGGRARGGLGGQHSASASGSRSHSGGAAVARRPSEGRSRTRRRQKGRQACEASGGDGSLGRKPICQGIRHVVTPTAQRHQQVEKAHSVIEPRNSSNFDSESSDSRPAMTSRSRQSVSISSTAASSLSMSPLE